MSAPSRFSLFKGTDKLCLNPYKYESNNDYPTEKVYISPMKPIVTTYINGFLLLIKKSEHYLSIFRPVIESSRSLKIGVCIRIYDKDNKTTDSVIFQDYHFEHRNERSRLASLRSYCSCHIQTEWPDDFCYATVDIRIMMIDTYENLSTITKEIGTKRNGYAYLEVNGGSIRVYKKALSNEIDYFKKLFERKKKMRYELDVDIEDMIEVIYCLPPFKRPIRSGLTYGALHRLSDKFYNLKLANMGDNYIGRIKRYAPILALYIAYEGNVIEEMKLNNIRDDETMTKRKLELVERSIERKHWLETGKEYCGRYKLRNNREMEKEL